MTRLKALETLLEKVLAGTATRMDPYFEFALYRGGKDMVTKVYMAQDAYQGSHDAAKALHEAVPTPNAVMSAEDMTLILFGNNGSRHWLAWKLKALIAIEKEQADG